jgi:hypothetical protein
MPLRLLIAYALIAAIMLWAGWVIRKSRKAKPRSYFRKRK